MIIEVLIAGVIALKEYIALHVLTCLIPAFLLAGAIVTFVSRETIIGYLGAAARIGCSGGEQRNPPSRWLCERGSSELKVYEFNFCAVI